MPNLPKFVVFPPFAERQAEMFPIYEHALLNERLGLQYLQSQLLGPFRQSTEKHLKRIS